MNFSRKWAHNPFKGRLIIQTSPQETPYDTPQVNNLLHALSEQIKPMSRDELQTILGLKDRKSFRARYLKPAIDNLLITMTRPDKPNSRLQRYVITELGLKVLGGNQ